ncbi:MAG: hypothetical protein KC435_01775 [Thermomicrobiales bacterium]|nr:hypothetical protein [Thermomicrobiales bacterium]
MSQQMHVAPLDRRIPLPGRFAVIYGVILVAAFLLRFVRLDGYLLNQREANWAYQSWSLFNGRPLPAGQSLSDSSPLMLLWNTLGYFLFGVTDATARVPSAILGVAMVASVLWLRPFLGRAQVLCVAGLLAISPTVVFASRTIEPGILAAFLALLAVITLLNIGVRENRIEVWTVAFGFVLATLYAVGPVGISTLIAVIIGILVARVADQGRKSPLATSLHTLTSNRSLMLTLFVSIIVTLLLCFSRLLTSLGALAGLGTALSDWVRMMADGSTQLPVNFYLWSLMLYETVAVIIAVVTLFMTIRGREIAPLFPIALFVGWFLSATVFFSLSASRDTGSAVIVALPILIIAGAGLGRILEGNSVRLIGPIMGYVALIAALTYGLNSAIGLAFTRGESGNEPLAWDTPAESAGEFIDQVMRLSHDLSITEANSVDPTGRYGLNIKVTPEYEWPFTWYFRDFEDFSVIPASGFDAETDVAIGADNAGMESANLTPDTRIWLIKPDDNLTRMRTSTIIKTALNPAKAWNYMIHRDAGATGEPRQITVGYSARIVNKLTTNTGPFNLFDVTNPEPGSGLGQLSSPTGITVGKDGTIYVLNAANGRVDRYDTNGVFLGIWSGRMDSALQLSWNGFQGGTALQVGPDGLIYIADTWNHAVIVVSADGTVVRVLGNRGIASDITDEGLVTDQPGLFFGPRDVAISDEYIYVTDTGNERVQVFTHDGTFVMAFGGYGSADGQFLEPTGIALAPDGNVWVADSGNARLQVFSADGTWLTSYAIPEWQGLQGTDRLNMLAFSPDGVLFYTVPGKGTFAWQDGKSVLVNGAVTRPGGIAFDADGNLLITDSTNATVIRFQPILPSDIEGTPEATPEG